ncbi:MAG: HNH endonuclease, partial [Rhizobiales bacterium]|nr:HNH endonuclease [Hyphomicrobiales bacterium]
MALVLAVDMAGVPSRWLMVEEAISYYARRMVAWSLGDTVATYHGGVSRLTGERS